MKSILLSSEECKKLGISNQYYNVEYKIINGEYILSACQHYTWEYCIGRGNTLENAYTNLKQVINMYDKDFHSFKNKKL